MTATQDLKDKLTQLRLKGMSGKRHDRQDEKKVSEKRSFFHTAPSHLDTP